MNDPTAQASIGFEIVGSGAALVLRDPEVLVAGYTGRDRAAVQRHIDELAAIGIPPPASVPAFYPMESGTLTQAARIAVAGANSSGEVEPVIIRQAGRYYLAVGSDHTDRDLERSDIARSKQACPKPISHRVVEVGADTDWDAIELACSVDGRAYQTGTTGELRPPIDVLATYDTTGERDIVMFGGTLPLIDGRFIAGARWDLSLRVPAGGVIEHSYAVDVTPTDGRR